MFSPGKFLFTETEDLKFAYFCSSSSCSMLKILGFFRNLNSHVVWLHETFSLQWNSTGSSGHWENLHTDYPVWEAESLEWAASLWDVVWGSQCHSLCPFSEPVWAATCIWVFRPCIPPKTWQVCGRKMEQPRNGIILTHGRQWFSYFTGTWISANMQLIKTPTVFEEAVWEYQTLVILPTGQFGFHINHGLGEQVSPWLAWGNILSCKAALCMKL